MGKAAKKVTKAVTKTVKSFVMSPIDGTKALLKGDIGGVVDAAVRYATYGTVSTGDNAGIIKMGLTNEPKVETPASTETEADGLLQYVNDLRTRKARRSRASTNNTAGSSSGGGNKLSGTTALGV